MRTLWATFHEPAPPNAPLEELQAELVTNLGMSETKVQAWAAAVRLKRPEAQTIKDVLVMSFQDMYNVFQVASLDADEQATIKICLGSATAPFEFTGPARVENSLQQLTEFDTNVSPPTKRNKGGCTTEVAEVLKIRRPELQSDMYFPPVEFDAHRPGMPTRDEHALRKLTVQEVCILYTHTSCQASLTPSD